MYEVTNLGETPRIFHDAFGKAQTVRGGKTVAMELPDSIVNIIEHAVGRGEPVRIRKMEDDEVLAYTPEPNLKPMEPLPPSAAELLPQLNELSYDEMLSHARRLMGETYNLGPRPKKLVVQAKLRELAQAEIEPPLPA